MDKQAIRDLFGKAWNAYASERKLAIREQLGQGYIADANVRLCDEMIAEQRARLDALLAEDDWHKWPEEQPSKPLTKDKTGFYLVMASSKKTGPYCTMWRWDGDWGQLEDDRFNLKITHWRPLPGPPATKCGQ